MSGILKAALFVSATAFICVSRYIYFSPLQSGVRAIQQLSPSEQHIAVLKCLEHMQS